MYNNSLSQVQWSVNGGKCGICGDSFSAPTPREHENGGTYGQKIIAKTYKSGQIIDIKVHLSASHLGDFTFGICNLDKSSETEDCFQPVIEFLKKTNSVNYLTFSFILLTVPKNSTKSQPHRITIYSSVYPKV